MISIKKIFPAVLPCIALAGMLRAQSPVPAVTPAPVTAKGFARDIWKDGLRYNFDDKGGRYVRITFLGQFWARYTENNPGTLFYDKVRKNQADFSLRRVRMQLFLQPHERWFVYSQFGINNFNYVSVRKPAFFLHDFTVEYMPVRNHLYIGGGLQSWGTSSRFGASAVGSIMALDIPVYQEPLNDQTDQFVRNLGVYVKGSLSKLNYRLTLNKPFAIIKADGYNSAIAPYANFAPRDPKFEVAGYLEWNFLEHETDKIPYKAGSHLGAKRLLNLGAGARYQPEAMWYRNGNNDTAFAPMILATVDLFAELPFKKGGQTFFNLYAAYTYSYFGPGYLRQVGPNGIATGSNLPASRLYGSGNSAPLAGTGNALYFQGGILTPALAKTELKLMPYVSVLAADYRVIKKPVTVYEAGLNFHIKGNALKLTAGWQNRPFFRTADSKALRLNMAILQMQVSI